MKDAKCVLERGFGSIEAAEWGDNLGLDVFFNWKQVVVEIEDGLVWGAIGDFVVNYMAQHVKAASGIDANYIVEPLLGNYVVVGYQMRLDQNCACSAVQTTP